MATENSREDGGDDVNDPKRSRAEGGQLVRTRVQGHKLMRKGERQHSQVLVHGGSDRGDVVGGLVDDDRVALTASEHGHLSSVVGCFKQYTVSVPSSLIIDPSSICRGKNSRKLTNEEALSAERAIVWFAERLAAGNEP